MIAEEIGRITITSGRLVVSDPCYLPETPGDLDSGTPWGTTVVEGLTPGSYPVFVERKDLGAWGVRNARLTLICGHGPRPATWEEVAVAGVDSGQMSFMDAALLPSWGGDVRETLEAFDPKKHSGEFNYEGACDATLNTEHHAGTIGEMMAVSSSGIGDGSYPVRVQKTADGKVLSVEVLFLDDEEVEDDGLE